MANVRESRFESAAPPRKRTINSVILSINWCALIRIMDVSYMLSFESMIGGYHEYRMIWNNPIAGEELPCYRELGNSHDPYAVAVKNFFAGEQKVVGHVPRRISAICSLFIRRGGDIRCQVTGDRRYSSDLLQGGLEIPAVLFFTAAKKMRAKKPKN